MKNIIQTAIPDVKIIDPSIHKDDRGYFYESYNKKLFDKDLASIDFIQDNESYSKKNVLRGLHFQKPPYEQSKLVRVIKGKIQDVVVDLRKESPTYLKYVSEVLSDENKKQIFVPKGFAHGFLVLSKYAIISYKVDAPYNTKSETGILYNDPLISIKWMQNESKFILSKKDKCFNLLENIE